MLRRDLLVVVLTATTGALDAVTFIGLGHVFSSVITGNLVLLGVAAGRRSGVLALSAALALSGYALGALLGARSAGTHQDEQPIWPARVTIALVFELVILAAFAGVWYGCGSHPAVTPRYFLLFMGATAMGAQSAAVRRLGSMSSTYLTSTLLGLLSALAVGRRPPDWQRGSAVLVMIVAGAAAGSLAMTRLPALVPVVILLPLTAVIALTRTLDSR